jgi:hypothetical protein
MTRTQRATVALAVLATVTAGCGGGATKTVDQQKLVACLAAKPGLRVDVNRHTDQTTGATLAPGAWAIDIESGNAEAGIVVERDADTAKSDEATYNAAAKVSARPMTVERHGNATVAYFSGNPVIKAVVDGCISQAG